MPFDPTKKAQLVTNAGQMITRLDSVENNLLGGAKDAAVTDADRQQVYNLLSQLQVFKQLLNAALASL